MISANARPLSTNPVRSKRRRCSLRRFGTSRSASTIAASPTGTFRKKIHRHDAYVVRNPPTGGPSSGAIRPGQVISAMALVSAVFSVVRNTASRPTGTIMAPPNPCTTRAATNGHRLLQAPHRMEPTVKIMIAAVNTSRVPNRSATHPLSGMNTARVSR